MVCIQRGGNQALSRGHCSCTKAIRRMRCSFCSKAKFADAVKTEEATSPGFVAQAGQVTGMLPFSRMTHFPMTARATAPTWVSASAQGSF